MADPARPSPWRRFLDRPNTDAAKTIGIAFLVALSAGVAVSTTAVSLRPLIAANVLAEREARMNAMLAGLPGIGALLAEVGAGAVEPMIVDLSTGLPATAFDLDSFDQAAIAADPATSTPLSRAEDLAGIGRRENFARTFEVRRDGRLALLVLPVYGSGYQSIIRAYLALEPDLATVAAFTVYEQGETPGLGARIAEPGWQAQWPGKIVASNGEILIEIVPEGATGPNEVDGVSGASVTGYALTDILHFWLGPMGYGPYLDALRKEHS
ncbi:Na+-translocating NADH-quinone reductase subunit C [Arsenicitalea aurantiaca]|uniref:Na(+)-translocating NADH-quinone reductase subunit C n=1 Tax=Arsenicitalea aurantiaca TaxID=1783274 RepID=A0A433XK95_9HYPH|nr:Na+-translocating NADH-quinone reductase subunit C [Arsenicitalea aurantiaca]RUT34489.1 Na+-translocating NADH-quinone reductase subunit C [Arsenicitalea aurantiaca]